jgi:hypothetical protein
MPTFVLVIVLLLHSSAFWDNNSNKTDSRSSAPRIRRNIMSNSATHENVITVTCFLIGLLVGAWRILVIGRKQGEIMYATLNICYNGYNFMWPTVNPVYQQVAFMKQFRLPYYRIIVSNSFFVLDDYQTSTEHAHDLTALILLQHMHSWWPRVHFWAQSWTSNAIR